MSNMISLTKNNDIKTGIETKNYSPTGAQEIREKIKDIEKELDELDKKIMKHKCYGKTKKEWAEDYYFMQEKIELLEQHENFLYKKLKEVNKQEYEQEQVKIKEEYKGHKYKLVYSDKVIYSDTYNLEDIDNILRVETLIKINNSFNRVNVFEKNSDTNSYTLREYEGGFLKMEKQVLISNKNCVILECYNRKYSNLSCCYLAISGCYRISFFNSSISLTTISIDKKGNVKWLYGTNFKEEEETSNKQKEDSKELFKKIKEKYINDNDIFKFLIKVTQ